MLFRQKTNSDSDMVPIRSWMMNRVFRFSNSLIVLTCRNYSCLSYVTGPYVVLCTPSTQRMINGHNLIVICSPSNILLQRPTTSLNVVVSVVLHIYGPSVQSWTFKRHSISSVKFNGCLKLFILSFQGLKNTETENHVHSASWHTRRKSFQIFIYDRNFVYWLLFC